MPFLSNTTINAQDDCRLLSLPPELRNRIYTEIFALPQTRHGSTMIRRDSGSQDRPHTILALLHTCKRLKSEAEGVFYSLNSIEINHHPWRSEPWSADPFVNHARWAKTLSIGRMCAVSKMTVYIESTAQANDMLDFMETMPGLRTLTFAMDRSTASIIANPELLAVFGSLLGGQNQWQPSARFFGRVRALKRARGWEVRAVEEVRDGQYHQGGNSRTVGDLDGELSAL